MKITPSPQQQAILDYVFAHVDEPGRKALAVKAGAGTGKTFTIVELLIKQLKAAGKLGKGGIYAAFNKDIVKEVEPKLEGTGVWAKSFHQIGMSGLMKHLKKKYNVYKADVDGDKYKTLIDEYIDQNPSLNTMFAEAADAFDDSSPGDVRREFRNASNQLCHFIRVKLVNWDDTETIWELVYDYGLDMEPVLNIGSLLDVMVEMQPTILNRGEQLLRTTGLMDFDDMVYYPVRWDVWIWGNRWVFIDEAQDLSPVQRKLVSKAVYNKDAFVIIVGDENQSIYRFTGADSNSFDLTTRWFSPFDSDETHCETLPLSVTRRCAKIIAHDANRLVPDFTPLAAAPRGKVVWLEEDKFAEHVRPGDMVISRTKAPLIGAAIDCIKEEIPATILGGNIGTALIDLLERIANSEKFKWNQAVQSVDEYQQARVWFFLNKEDQEAADAIRDDCEAVKVLLENSQATNIDTFSNYVNVLFSDQDGKGKVILCTGHKSKGLEAERVFLLRPEKMPLRYPNMHPESYRQEKNLLYVAITRAKRELVYLTNEDFMKPYDEGNREIPSYIQYDFDNHTWTEDLLYMTDAQGNVVKQLPNGGTMPTTRPEPEETPEEVTVIDANDLVTEVDEPEASDEPVLTLEEADAVLYATNDTQDDEPLSDEDEAMLSAENGIPPIVEAQNVGVYNEPEENDSEDDVDDATADIPDIDEIAAEDAPVIPTAPVEWAKYVVEHPEQFVVLDTETTDSSKNRDNFEVIQLSILDMTGKVLYSKYIQPRVSKISSGAQAVHGITHDKVATAGYIGMQISDIREAIEGRHVIAYNVSFDKDALENSLRLSNREKDMPQVAGWHCAMMKYVAHNPNKKSPWGKPGGWWKLTEALPQQGIEASEDAHDALADVLMTIDLIKSMAEDDPNRWRNRYGYQEGDVVKVKASGAIMTINKTLASGELNLIDPRDDSRQTMSAAAVELVENPAYTDSDADEPQAPDEPVVEDTIEIVEPIADEPEAIEPVAETPAEEAESEDDTEDDADDTPATKQSGLFTEVEVKLDKAPADEKPVEPVLIPQRPQPANSYTGLEKMVERFGSRDKALAAIDLLTNIVNEMFPAEAN